MDNRLLQKTTAFCRTYPIWISVLYGFMLLLRLTEQQQLRVGLPEGDALGLFLCGAINDALFLLSLAAMLFVPVLLFWCWRPKTSWLFFTAFASLLLLSMYSFSRYYLTTNVLLGADLFGYSVSELQTTVSSSTRLVPADLLIVLLLGGFILLLYGLRKRAVVAPVWTMAPLLGAGIFGAFHQNAAGVSQPAAARQFAMNKSAYFVVSSLQSVQPPATAMQFEGYPLLRNDDSRDVLTPYFNLPAAKPNIVFLIVEGLGRDFTGPGASYGGFTPFLDSLSQQGLYWSHFFSSAGRSFAGLPSILASLPYDQNGFNALGAEMPAHVSLISLLKNNGYKTRFFYGGNANFDQQDIFLERQGIDFILDENKFGPGYSRNFNGGESWGYPDGDVYERSLELLPTGKEPQLNIYFTLSTHEPFAIPQNQRYQEQLDGIMASLPAAKRTKLEPHKEVWKALLYSDESLRQFFAVARQRPEYANTIFVITGDHRLIPVPEQNALSRFHVPLLIYSPLLKKPAVFPALSSHHDITPSLVQLLRHHPDLQFPSQVHWLGKGLDTAGKLAEDYEMPFMRNKNGLEDYISGRYLLSGGRLFRLNDEMWPVEDGNTKMKACLAAKLDSFRQLNRYVCRQNRLWNEGRTAPAAAPAFTATEVKMLDSLSGGFAQPDTLFARARRLAFSGYYEEARLLCRKVLHGSPNYHDVRVLYGRTYAWEKKYQKAIPAFAEVIRRNPEYEDAYLAWIDAATWAGKRDSAWLVVRRGLSVLPGSEGIKQKQLRLTAAK